MTSIIAVATWTFLLSVLAHGLSAQPLSAWYTRRPKATTEQHVELSEVPELLSLIGDSEHAPIPH